MVAEVPGPSIRACVFPCPMDAGGGADTARLSVKVPVRFWASVTAQAIEDEAGEVLAGTV